MLSGKGLLKQALVLSVKHVVSLHTIFGGCCTAHWGQSVGGLFAFCLYGRCRNSDLFAIRTLMPDFGVEGGFVIITPCNHKSGMMAAPKTRLLPVVVPARGVDGSNWKSTALKVISEFGCPTGIFNDGPLLPAPSKGFGDFMQRGLRSSEVSKMLRTFLGTSSDTRPDSGEIASSHSLKAIFACMDSALRHDPPDKVAFGSPHVMPSMKHLLSIPVIWPAPQLLSFRN